MQKDENLLSISLNSGVFLKKGNADVVFLTPAFFIPMNRSCSMQLNFLYNLFHSLSALFFGFVGRITERNEGYGFNVFGQFEKAFAYCRVECTYPTGAKSLLGSGQAKVFYGNADVHIGMVLTLVPAFP